MGQKTAFAARLAGFFKTGDRKVKFITILGVAGILVIFLPSLQEPGSQRLRPILFRQRTPPRIPPRFRSSCPP